MAIDGEVLIVGSPFADVSSENSAGQAYIFRFDSSDWVEEDILTATTPDAGDFFGYSVSISGDGALVGAPYEDSATAFKIGAAYVFRYNSGTEEWDDEVRLTACDETAGAEYGFSVSLDGDHAAIGATENGSAQDAGSAYAYRNIASGWVDLDKFSAFDDDNGDYLGAAISISGDKVLVAAPFWDVTGNNGEGAMYNFEGVQCPWDLNNDGVVSTFDLLMLLSQWGTDGPADFDGSGAVGTSDLLALLTHWGPCACGLPEPLSLEDEMDDTCLTMDNWDDFEEIMKTGTEAEKENYLCWMEHYLYDCTKCSCTVPPSCPDDDPFDD